MRFLGDQELNTKELILDRVSKIQRKNKLEEFLRNSSYFSDPASGSYHANYPGGLADHSYNLYLILWDSVQRYGLANRYSEESCFLIAILHDLCKVGTYKVEECWKKTNGKWESYFGYTFSERGLELPHGMQSARIASKLIHLTDVEFAAIVYHMGVFDSSNSLDRDFGDACRKEPIIWLTHSADMVSAIVYEPLYKKDEIPFITI